MGLFDAFNGMPSRAWLNDQQTPPFTPDLYLFEQGQYHLFFEYGDLQDRMPKHQMVNPYATLVAYTVEKYGLITQFAQDEPYPLAFEDKFSNRIIRRQKIKGELYAVQKKNVILIDSYRENGLKFHRHRVKLILPWFRSPETHREKLSGQPQPIVVTAWMYFGVPVYWDRQIVWDASFYRGRRGSLFPEVKVYTDSNAAFNNHYHFTRSDLSSHKDGRCFLYHHRHIADPVEPSHEEKQKVEIVVNQQASPK